MVTNHILPSWLVTVRLRKQECIHDEKILSVRHGMKRNAAPC